MKTSSVILAASKAGLRMDSYGDKIWFESDSVSGAFTDQNGDAVDLRTITKEYRAEYELAEDCSMAFYTFHSSIKSFLASFA